ncbi:MULTISPECIES: DUF397 domain-containing protein [unclassified Streptomyces]|uniref:DUF397 domain-containing protein n=1 Tax=unclassified Streptomyces TaxID=2593676 RepID=UPI002E2852F3|nr:DUF397 domain-containing protein [Streptomyces sp. NBC_01423]WSX91980.1 DUF397 domain-containing protein [Streptomyces sp. NBC_00891]WSY06457.1 DUF397 domain-containing protein [Streptomyces sp. NBC_00890]WSZ08081.1 DUF397 domain-containing protein [Streptomyces sp. NBC_00869]WSZ24419.1 DUF397 domain-containing protein [Streptomyces sp. NBC_00870]
MKVFQFVKSSYSTLEKDCVEVARNVPGAVAVRDSKVPVSAVLVVAPAAWDAFTHGLCEPSATGTKS